MRATLRPGAGLLDSIAPHDEHSRFDVLDDGSRTRLLDAVRAPDRRTVRVAYTAAEGQDSRIDERSDA